MRGIFFALLFTIFSCSLTAQIDLTRSRIVVDNSMHSDSIAACLLQRYVIEISGKNIATISATQAKRGDIVIGQANKKEIRTLKKDGFAISTTDGFVRIISKSGGRGSIYGVCELLERYFGVRYWSPEACDVPRQKNMLLNAGIEIEENPMFEYRQATGYSEFDPVYKMFHRLDWPTEIFASNLWVHTFNRLISAKEYGKEHPEYFAYVRGERKTGDQSQLCLTNQDVFLIVAHKLDSIFALDPTRKTISVSQNDGNYNNCTCDKCRAIDEREGSPSGSIVYFMNKLAERFPDKEISTLAYVYSVAPPKYMKPLPNVNIMLCNIESTRELPLTKSDNGRQFVDYLKGWSKISNNIFMWDYGINFDNYISPFPNFHILQENLQLFHKSNVKKMFEQVNVYKGVDFAELRGYILSKLMWNPYRDFDALMRESISDYYGDASKYIYDYIKLQQGALLGSGRPLLIYDSPISHMNGFLSSELVGEYNKLFDRAESAVADNAEHLRRVRRSRLSLQYAELELLRTSTNRDAEQLAQKLDLFKERTNGLELKINEKQNTPESYCLDFESRHLPKDVVNLAKGAKIEWQTSPSKQYAQGAEEKMTDGLHGGTSYVDGWVGWEGSDGEFTLDMGTQKEFSSISGGFLHQTNRWIFLPRSVEYLTSCDNKTFTQFGIVAKAENRYTQTLFDNYTATKSEPIKARYVKVKIESIQKCPSWHYGFGYVAWCFIDEITITK